MISYIYAIFTDEPNGDNPSVMHYIGNNLEQVNIEELEDYFEELNDSEDVDTLCYLCKFELANGGLNMFQNLVDFHAQPDLIETFCVFKTNYLGFINHFNRYIESDEYLYQQSE